MMRRVVSVTIVTLILKNIFLCPHDETKGKIGWTIEIVDVFDEDTITIIGWQRFDLKVGREGGRRRGKRERE
jgi:hypothetical protein